MTTKTQKNRAMLDLGLFAAMLAFIAVLIGRQHVPASLFAPLLAALFLAATGFSIAREKRIEDRLDEVELAGASFGARWAITAVGIFVMLVLFVSPLQDALIGYFSAMQASQGSPIPAPLRPFVLGLGSAMAIYLAAKSALAVIWKRAKR